MARAEKGIATGQASETVRQDTTCWNFPEVREAEAYLSNAVLNHQEPVTFVCHELEDGVWQFLGDTMAESGAVRVCLHHPIDDDPSLNELADLPRGWCAERSQPGAPWIRGEMSDEGSSGGAEDPQS